MLQHTQCGRRAHVRLRVCCLFSCDSKPEVRDLAALKISSDACCSLSTPLCSLCPRMLVQWLQRSGTSAFLVTRDDNHNAPPTKPINHTGMADIVFKTDNQLLRERAPPGHCVHSGAVGGHDSQKSHRQREVVHRCTVCNTCITVLVRYTFGKATQPSSLAFDGACVSSQRHGHRDDRECGVCDQRRAHSSESRAV